MSTSLVWHVSVSCFPKLFTQHDTMVVQHGFGSTFQAVSLTAATGPANDLTPSAACGQTPSAGLNSVAAQIANVQGDNPLLLSNVAPLWCHGVLPSQLDIYLWAVT